MLRCRPAQRLDDFSLEGAHLRCPPLATAIAPYHIHGLEIGKPLEQALARVRQPPLTTGTLQNGPHQERQQGDEYQPLNAPIRAHKERVHHQRAFGVADTFLYPILALEQGQSLIAIQMGGAGGQSITAI
jgi:hypothetical protein